MEITNISIITQNLNKLNALGKNKKYQIKTKSHYTLVTRKHLRHKYTDKTDFEAKNITRCQLSENKKSNHFLAFWLRSSVENLKSHFIIIKSKIHRVLKLTGT